MSTQNFTDTIVTPDVTRQTAEYEGMYMYTPQVPPQRVLFAIQFEGEWRTVSHDTQSGLDIFYWNHFRHYIVKE